MTLRLPLAALAVVTAIVSAGARAQASAPAAPPAPAAAPASAASEPLAQDAPHSKVPEAKVEHLVTEDSQVRIEETRVRGVPTDIVVHSKIRGMGSYGIQTRKPAFQPSEDPGAGLPSLSFGF
jgi:hypothetical protein